MVIPDAGRFRPVFRKNKKHYNNDDAADRARDRGSIAVTVQAGTLVQSALPFSELRQHLACQAIMRRRRVGANPPFSNVLQTVGCHPPYNSGFMFLRQFARNCWPNS
jgi:hypothetical protein